MKLALHDTLTNLYHSRKLLRNPYKNWKYMEKMVEFPKNMYSEDEVASSYNK